jgi:glutaredoxin
MKRSTVLVWTLLFLLPIVACQRAAAPAATAASAVPAPPAPPVVGDGPGDFLLRYFTPATGELVAVAARTDVPEGARGQVLVVPQDPAKLGPWLYVADLTRKSGSHYEVRVVNRADLERQVAAARPAPKPEPSAAAAAPAVVAGEVVLYRTTWCGYCKKTAEYLTLKGVPFVEKDLERDPGAREDMLARAAKAGVGQDQLTGVPILAIRGKIIAGFDRNAIDQALR